MLKNKNGREPPNPTGHIDPFLSLPSAQQREKEKRKKIKGKRKARVQLT
jgi:hypothetical protein